MKQAEISVSTRGRGTYDLTRELQSRVRECDIETGLCHLFLQHTSASLILCENADPTVRDDLEMVMARLAPDGDPDYRHDMEGPDDMPAHIRSVLTHNAMTLPIRNGKLALGTWQGVYLWEHRTRPHRRRLLVTFQD